MGGQIGPYDKMTFEQRPGGGEGVAVWISEGKIDLFNLLTDIIYFIWSLSLKERIEMLLFRFHASTCVTPN